MLGAKGFVAVGTAVGAVPFLFAIVKGLRWWREIRQSAKCPKLHAGEVTFLLLALVPGLIFIVCCFDSDENELIPLGALMSLGMGCGAFLGWLYAHARGSGCASKHVRPPLSAVGMMTEGTLFAGGWCFVLLVTVPSLVPSRIASNESAAIGALRTYGAAQTVFRKTDNYGNGKRVYANPVDGEGFPDLYEVGGPGSGGKVLGLVEQAFAEATSPERARHGYWFVDITGDANGPYDHSKQFGLCAVPAEYGRSGRNTFIIDTRGEVCQRYTEGNPLTTWPDLEEEGWFPVGGK